MPTGTNAFLTDPNNNVGAIAPLGQVYTNETFPILMASYHQSITGSSGGTNLPNVPCGKVRIQNLSGNGVMWVGGVGQSAPYSGRGNELFDMSTVAGAQGETMYVNNANQISLCAINSGQLISFMAYGNATTAVINPATQGIAPNETQPVLSGTTPAANSTNNPFNTAVTFTFNIPMDPNNISGLYIVTSGQATPSMLGHLGGTLTYLSGSVNATFQPNSGQLQLSGWYIPMVDPSVHGYNGLGISGTVGNPGAANSGAITTSGNPFQVQGPPIVSGLSYASGIQGTSGQPFTVIFSQPMLSGTINISGIYVLATGTSTPHISGTVSLSSTNSGTQAVFQFYSGVLANSQWYTPIITTETEDQFGNPLNQLTSGYGFETAAIFGPDTTPPKVSGTNPVSGATGVLVIPTVQLTMSKSINSGFVTTNTVKVHDIQTADTNVVGTVSLQSDLITIDWTPSNPLVNLDLHRMELSGVQDLAGNFMTPFSGATFTVEPVLQVSGSTPTSGASSVSVTPILQLTMDRAVLSGTVNTSTCKLADQNNSNITIGSVSLTSDNITVAFTPSIALGYLVPYTYEVSGIVDVNNQQFMFPFSGATFNTIAPSLTQIYNVNGNNTQFLGGNTSQSQGSVYAVGEQITSNSANMFGKVIKQAQFVLSRVGNPTGNVIAYVRDSSNVAQTVLGSIPVSSLSTSNTTYTFSNLSGSFAMGTNSKVTCEYSGGNNSNYITIQYTTSNAYTATEAAEYFFQDVGGGTGWQTNLNGSFDIGGIFSY